MYTWVTYYHAVQMKGNMAAWGVIPLLLLSFWSRGEGGTCLALKVTLWGKFRQITSFMVLCNREGGGGGWVPLSSSWINLSWLFFPNDMIFFFIFDIFSLIQTMLALTCTLYKDKEGLQFCSQSESVKVQPSFKNLRANWPVLLWDLLM